MAWTDLFWSVRPSSIERIGKLGYFQLDSTWRLGNEGGEPGGEGNTRATTDETTRNRLVMSRRIDQSKETTTTTTTTTIAPLDEYKYDQRQQQQQSKAKQNLFTQSSQSGALENLQVEGATRACGCWSRTCLSCRRRRRRPSDVVFA